ncbi:MAG: tRNA pseudouridine(38-40) synthase TruA [Balneolaceae bacterium]
MVRWKLTLQYDGTRFAGWQRQPDQRTVQGELERALSRFFDRETVVMGQGRTDSGVHAEGQVAHSDFPEPVDSDRLFRAMRSLLPPDMALIRAEAVPAGFHARFDASSRRYRYQISLQPVPLMKHLYWELPYDPDPDSLHRTAELVQGSHDFKNFSRLEDEEANSHCTITRSQWTIEGTRLFYRIEGDRFLRHLVRRLTGSMVLAATGRSTLEEFQLLLEGGDVARKGHSAPAHGLLLESVHYPTDSGC